MIHPPFFATKIRIILKTKLLRLNLLQINLL